ncbi:MAG: hypothetical protein R2751_06785 [Bacteroidales bacterium]
MKKKTIVWLLLAMPFLPVLAQREYLPTPEDLDRFHHTTTYVVMNDNPLSAYNFEIQDALKKFWTITDYEIISHDDFAAKSSNTNASFLYVATVNFEKDRSNTRYIFLCLSLGGDHQTIDDLKDIANIPLGYNGVPEEDYTYKLSTLLRFLQEHVKLITAHPDMVSQNVYEHYNENMESLKGKTLYVVKDELGRDVNTEAKIKAIYPLPVKIVERDEIGELILAADPNTVFLHKVGPEGKGQNSRVYKILIGAAEAKFYYFDYHKASDKTPDAFLSSDFKKLAKANQ